MPERILKLLKPGGSVSGGRIAKDLGLTRAAVWKKIDALRKNGFEIDAAPGKGYRLIGSPDLSPDELKSLLPSGWSLIFLKETASTNDYAMRLGAEGSAHGTTVLAEKQTKGKGRLGRVWASPPGNIYMSVLLRPSMEPKEATLLTILSSVSAAKAIRRLSGLPVAIKWPNDLMVADRKIGGILLEMRSEPDRVLFAVLGMGINVNMGLKSLMRLKSLPSGLKETATSVLEETGKKIKRTDVVSEILKELEMSLKTLEKHGRGAILDEWRGLSSTPGRDVLVTAGNATLRGRAEDIDEEGRLVISLKDGSVRTISSGDLTLLR